MSGDEAARAATEGPAAVRALLNRVKHPVRRRDAETLLDLFGRTTGAAPQVWHGSIIGFGEYHYEYASGRKGDSAAAGFAPRAAATTVYLPDGVGAHADRLERLGPHTTGVGCLYLKNLAAIDLDVLAEIVGASFSTVTRGTFGRRARDSAGGTRAIPD
ncbi:DUF1801 domain-containing protein [Leifsonia poae]|uniref:DUF1801 domain-containing protein n=1 Tax=Leifsonia poae TaxID=110933 RepID=UPI001CC175DD|nr:DUF1801 domain-containing protein [Leifsonia poae]